VVKVSVERAIARGSSRGFEAIPPVWYVALPLPSSCATKDTFYLQLAFTSSMARGGCCGAATVTTPRRTAVAESKWDSTSTCEPTGVKTPMRAGTK